ncbi:MAG: TMEM165/GDT1 family protein [Bdellovibrionota bacterium]
MFETILSAFGVVALSEMGDKTQLLAFSLAARFKKPWQVMLGILLATILNHALASTVGNWVASQIAPRTLSYVLAFTFFAFGIWTLKPDELEEQEEESKYGALVTTTLLFFIAEMGDKTQLATVALAAQFRSAVWVTVGTTAGMLFTDGLAVLVGEKLAEKIPMKYVRWTAAATFIAFGIYILVAG